MEKRTSNSQEVDVRKGPWTMEEDLILINYIANHGEGVWNSLAKAAGLKRTGKSCRLRWLNYLRPDVRRGNITPEEQLLIMELHAKWGNRWSKIAKHLPGRTDNEIKNFWRTRVQKHMKQAENNFASGGGCGGGGGGGRCYEQASSSTSHSHSHSHSQLSGTADTMEMDSSYSPSYNHHHHHTSTTSFPAADAPPNENYWSMEDLWSMHLLN